MSEIHLYECDNCHRTEKPGKEVVGWIAVIVARMILPGMDKGHKGVVSKEFCSTECAEVGLPRTEIPRPLKPLEMAIDFEGRSRHDNDSVMPGLGQYL